jgi:hypothetical protein
MEALKNPSLNFALFLNLKINLENNKEASGDYLAVAKYITNMEKLWITPLIKLENSEILKDLKQIYQNVNKVKAINKFHDFVINETKIKLTKIIKDYPENLKEGIPTTMTIFGGFTNAVSIHLALVKIVLEKIEDINRRGDTQKAIESLKHCSSQFAKLQANTLKLIENINGVISNQEEAYNFDSNNFFLDDELKLLPTEEFLNQVIKKANDPLTEIESYNYKEDYHTPYVEKKNFMDTYTKPRGCPIYASKKANSNLLDDFLDKITAIMTQIITKDDSLE